MTMVKFEPGRIQRRRELVMGSGLVAALMLVIVTDLS